MLYVSVHWGDLIEQIKKICHIDFNNGWASSYFSPERGVGQCCPLSPYIFILCAGVLTNKIQENKDIKGITVCGNEIKISQYADDTNMILDGSKNLRPLHLPYST